MPTTTNYGWTTPADTDLVKDGASAIRTLGSSIDTTTKALNPSTTLGDIEYRSSTANTNTRLAIGTAGQVLTVNGGVPAWTTIATGSTFAGCALYDSGNQSIPDSTFTTLTYNTEVFDIGGYHSTSSNTDTITIPAGKAGYYIFCLNVQWTGSTGGYRIVYLQKNGGYSNGQMRYWATSTNSGERNSSYSTIVYGAVGDTFRTAVLQNSGGARIVEKDAQYGIFSCSYLGA